MPRLRLESGKGKRRRHLSANGGNGANSNSTAPNKTNEFGLKGDSALLDEFPDYDRDEFEFIDSKTGLDRAKKSTAALAERTPPTDASSSDDSLEEFAPPENRRSPSVTNKSAVSVESISPRMPTVEGRKITVKDLSKSAKKPLAKSGKANGYTKLFNSSTDWKENDSTVNMGEGSKEKGGKSKPKKPKVSFEKTAKSASDGNKKSAAKNAKKKKSKTEEEKLQSILHDGLDDTDDEASTFTKVATLPRAISRTVSGRQRTDTQNKMKILPFRGIGIDNRALPNHQGDAMTRSFLVKMIGFMKGALEKDLLDDIGDGGTVLACLQEKSVQAKYLFEGRDISTRDRVQWFSDFLTPMNRGGVADEAENFFDYGSDDMSLDFVEGRARKFEGFEASDSWKYFGEMVETMHRKVSSTKPTSPYDLSIFTTDAAFFVDTNPESHMASLNQFWKRVSKVLWTNAVSSLTIIVVDTTSAVQVMNAAKEYGSYSNDEFSNSGMPNRLQILQCINLIRRRIHELADAVVKLKLEFMDGSVVDFQTLLQMWMRESFDQTYRSVSGTSGVDGKLRFELPETIDGTMCSISLDLKYTVLPGRIDSNATMELVQDMMMLSSLSPTSVEVLQTIPLHSVDSSLINGVPMYAQVGFDNDLFQYNQMKILVRQLWKYLSRNDVALVLRVRRQAEDDERDDGAIIASCAADSRSDDQLFLLTSQVAVQKQSISLENEKAMQTTTALDVVPDRHRKGEAPCNGILYRYATKNQILHFGNEESDKLGQEVDDSAEASEYADYIERSMDMLTSTGLNPFLVQC